MTESGTTGGHIQSISD